MQGNLTKSIVLISNLMFLLFPGIASQAQESSISHPSGQPGSSSKVLSLGVKEAVLLGLENNRSLRVEKLSPAISKTYEEEEKAKFDPGFVSNLSLSRQHSQSPARTTGALTGSTSSQIHLDAGISRFSPQGTTFSAGISTEKDWSSLYSNQHTTRLGITVTQALLKGGSSEANLAKIKQARINTLLSEYQLRGFVENLVAEIEKTYWQYTLARKEIEIYQESLRLAEEQLKETEQRINVGKLAEIELSAARAEVALRQEAVITATSNLENIRLHLLSLLNLTDQQWKIEIIPRDLPAVPEIQLDTVEDHCQLALRLRPEINQARLSLQKGELELVKTKNGLLPKLDFFITLGKTGYSSSFGGSWQDITGKGYDVSAGLVLEWPSGNRQAKAQHQRALVTRQQTEEALENLSQLVSLDVRCAYLKVNSSFQQIKAAAATRVLQEEKLRAETEKFRVGKSTPLLVAQVQRDLLASQIGEIEAVVKYINSLVELFHMEGSLLERRGLSLQSF